MDASAKPLGSQTTGRRAQVAAQRLDSRRSRPFERRALMKPARFAVLALVGIATTILMAAGFGAITITEPFRFSGSTSSAREAAEEKPTFYVDGDSLSGRCDDSRSAAQAGSVTTPWCSMGRAAAVAPPGGVVYVRAGAYDRTTLAGARTGEVTLAPYEDETVSVQGFDVETDFVRLEGFSATETIRVMPGHGNIEIVDNRIRTNNPDGFPDNPGKGNSGVVLDEGAHDVVIAENQISHGPNVVSAFGILLSAGSTQPDIERITIRSNKLGPLSRTAMSIKNFRDVLIEDNEVFDAVRRHPLSHIDIVHAYQGGQNLTIRGNLFRDSEAQGIFIQEVGGRVTDVLIEDNLLMNGTPPWKAINAWDVDNVIIRHNTLHDWGGSLYYSADPKTVGGQIYDNVSTSSGKTNTGLIIGDADGDSVKKPPQAEHHNLFGKVAGDTPDPTTIIGAPTFAGPNNYSLATGSPGENDASDGNDMGALTSLLIP